MTDHAAHLRSYLARIFATQKVTPRRAEVALRLVQLIADRTGDSRDAIRERAIDDALDLIAREQAEGGDTQ